MPLGERQSRELRSTVTRKGQATIPVEIRRLLGLRASDQLAWQIEAGQVRVTRARSVVERTAGITRNAKVGHHPISAEELRERAEQAIAEEAVERMG